MKNFLKKRLPSISKIKANPNLKMFGKLLHDPNLWYLSRRSLSGGTAVGLFVAFIPVPLQTLIAAAIAIVFRVNLPISVSLVFITNPITMPLFFYFAYIIGTILLGMEVLPMNELWSYDIVLPLSVGCFVVGSITALTGYILVNLLWRLHIKSLWRKRTKKKVPLILRANT